MKKEIEQEEKCPYCGGPLVKMYHIVIPQPIWLGCRNCKKMIKPTKEEGCVSSRQAEESLLGE